MTVDELVAKLAEYPGYWRVVTSDSELGFPDVDMVEAIQEVARFPAGQITPLVVLS